MASRLSTFYIHVLDVILINFVCHVLRCCAYIHLHDEEFKYLLVEEFIYTIDVCATYRELGFLEEAFGIWRFAALSIIVEIWWKCAVRVAAGNPIHYIAIIVRTRDLVALYGIAVEFIAAPVAWLVNNQLWKWNAEREEAELYCTSLLNVSTFHGMLVEGGLVFIKTLFDYSTERVAMLRYKIVSALIDASLVLIALDLSGGFFNPITSTVRHFTCEGHTVAQFLLVYWFGPIVGIIMATEIYGIFYPYDNEPLDFLEYLLQRGKKYFDL